MRLVPFRGPFCDCPGAAGGPVVRCPRRNERDVECVPTPRDPGRDVTPVDTTSAISGGEQPFLRYRDRLWASALASGDELDDLIGSLDGALTTVAGAGLAVSPLVDGTPVTAASSRPGVRLVVKDETNQPAGSHKIRHVFGTALHLALAIARGEVAERPPLVISSCGNAALAAATMARAADWPLEVFVPPDGHPAVLAELAELGATVTTCPRLDDSPGDPCYRRFLDAVAGGAVAFGVTGPDNALCIDGGRTLGWELAEQAARRVGAIDDLVIQVGGGALASSVARGIDESIAAGVLPRRPRLHTLQTAGAAPLARAARLISRRSRRHGLGASMAWAVRHRSEVMWPWEEEPHSCATGILDDETYDWAALTDAVLSSGGSCPVVHEGALLRANRLVNEELGIDADETGTAGVAGVIERLPEFANGTAVAALLTGIRRRA